MRSSTSSHLTHRPEFDPARQPSVLRSVLVLLGLGKNPTNSTIRQRVMDSYFEPPFRLSAAAVARHRRRVFGAQSRPCGGGRQRDRRRFRQAAAERQTRIRRRRDRVAAAGDRAPARESGRCRAGGRRLPLRTTGSSDVNQGRDGQDIGDRQPVDPAAWRDQFASWRGRARRAPKPQARADQVGTLSSRRAARPTRPRKC